jgi:hypothetical protein
LQPRMCVWFDCHGLLVRVLLHHSVLQAAAA